MPPIARSRLGFTLIEMMLVVIVIVMLIALLMPALQRTRSVARTMACQVNQRTLAQATLNYSTDWNGKLFPYDNVNSLKYATFWMTLIDAYTGDIDQFRMCPETVITPEAQTGAYAAGWGTVRGAWGMPWVAGGWGFLGSNYGSYGWNSWMHSNRTDYVKRKAEGTITPGELADAARYWKSVKLCKTPNKTPFFSDMHWVDSWFQNKQGGTVSPPPANLFAENSAAGRVCINRHSRGVCHGYVDGSAGWTALEDLWQLTWNSESTPMDPPWALPGQ